MSIIFLPIIHSISIKIVCISIAFMRAYKFWFILVNMRKFCDIMRKIEACAICWSNFRESFLRGNESCELKSSVRRSFALSWKWIETFFWQYFNLYVRSKQARAPADYKRVSFHPSRIERRQVNCKLLPI